MSTLDHQFSNVFFSFYNTANIKRSKGEEDKTFKWAEDLQTEIQEYLDNV